MAADAPLADRRAAVRLPDLPRGADPAEAAQGDAGVARRDERADRGDAVRLGRAADEGVRALRRRGRALPPREPAPRRPPGAPADGRAHVLRARRHLLQLRAGARLPRLRARDLLRRRQADQRGHDRRVHGAPDAALLPDRLHAPGVDRDPVLARAVRADLPVPRPAARDRRPAGRAAGSTSTRSTGGSSFRDVWFAYESQAAAEVDGDLGPPRRWALEHVDFEVEPGPARRARRAERRRQDDDHVPDPAALRGDRRRRRDRRDRREATSRSARSPRRSGW